METTVELDAVVGVVVACAVVTTSELVACLMVGMIDDV